MSEERISGYDESGPATGVFNFTGVSTAKDDLQGLTVQVLIAALHSDRKMGNGAKSIGVEDIPQVIADIAKAIDAITPASSVVSELAPATTTTMGYPGRDVAHGPAHPIDKSITDDRLISLEDGKPYQALKRHLTTVGLTPQEYRAKWGLPPDYPMVHKNYSERRTALAKEFGLGRKRNLVETLPESAEVLPDAVAEVVGKVQAPKRVRPSRAKGKPPLPSDAEFGEAA